MIEKIHKLKKSGKRIGFTASTAELAHPGFIDMLLQARQECDFLIFGLLTDPTISRPATKNKPVETTFERWVRLSAIKYIDMIIPFDTEEDLENMINLIQPSVRFVGEEYKGTEHTGWNLCPISYNTRKHNWSSSGLRKKIYKIEKDNKPKKLKDSVKDFDKDWAKDEHDSSAELIKVPSNLKEAFDILDKIEGLNLWVLDEENAAVASAHHGIGRVIRNDWGLWSNGNMKTFFNKIGITHPDDMSSIILTSYHRYRNNKPINISKQVNYYRKLWENTQRGDNNGLPNKI